MSKIRLSVSQPIARDYPATFLVITTAGLYLIFQLIVLYGALMLEGVCLYSFWLPYEQWWLTPYWGFLVAIVGLFVLAMALFIRGCAGRYPVSIVAGLVLAISLGLWIYGMTGLWRAMQYEKGFIPQASWIAEAGGIDWLGFDDDQRCEPDI